MALPVPPPARVFAELLPTPAPASAPAGGGGGGGGGPPAPSGREVHVSGSAELSAGPDRARVSLRLGSRKGAAGAARSSVSRRLEYIAQSARQRGVTEENMTVTEDFSRVEDTYQMEAELPELEAMQGRGQERMGNNNGVGSANLDLLKPQLNSTWTLVYSTRLCHQLAATALLCKNKESGIREGVPDLIVRTLCWEVKVCIIFSDFGKMQNVCNLLIEKLGTSVTISPPHFYHTPEAVDTLRRQVCVAAVGNTRRKAQEVCQLFGQSLGKPLLIREEETKEWGGHIDNHLSNSPDSLTLQERIQNATAYASCRVFAVFEIKGKENRRNKLL